jgi:cellulose synthase/poly-beta-1,6-N-acetylglucosamine synthase-like glycosyltransferase
VPAGPAAARNIMITIATIVFWTAAGLVFFTYAGYSLVIFALSLLRRRPIRRADITPRVTFLITAYNEEKDIGRKIEQTLALDYPSDRLEVVVASDGSTDRTDDVVRAYESRGVRLVRVEGRVGKTETQNQAVAIATGDVIVFSDATTRYERTALRKLVRNYADDTVGAVSGRYEYFNPSGAPIGVGSILFWKYENLIKTLQTNIRTITGCCGCIYSVRRSLYEPLPPDIISDLCEPLKVLEKGYRIVFEPEAIAYEETTAHTDEEFNMRVRVITRGMRGLLYMRRLFSPARFPFVAFQLLAHKVLRWLIPLLLLAVLAANAVLIGSPFYKATLGLQVLFYMLAAAGYATEGHGLKTKLLTVPLYFVTVNLAAVVAMHRVWRGHKAVTWETVRK